MRDCINVMEKKRWNKKINESKKDEKKKQNVNERAERDFGATRHASILKYSRENHLKQEENI